SRLVDEHLAVVQALDLGGVHIDAHHIVTHFRKARPGYKANVAGAKDRYLHFCLPLVSKKSAAYLRLAFRNRHPQLCEPASLRKRLSPSLLQHPTAARRITSAPPR